MRKSRRLTAPIFYLGVIVLPILVRHGGGPGRPRPRRQGRIYARARFPSTGFLQICFTASKKGRKTRFTACWRVACIAYPER